MNENEEISAFAFKTGKNIEKFINKTNNYPLNQPIESYKMILLDLSK